MDYRWWTDEQIKLAITISNLIINMPTNNPLKIYNLNDSKIRLHGITK